MSAIKTNSYVPGVMVPSAGSATIPLSNQGPVYDASSNSFQKDEDDIKLKMVYGYDKNKIIAVQNVMVSQSSLGGTNAQGGPNTGFSANINIRFVPDFVIVRSVNYQQTAGSGKLWFLRSSLILNQTLAVFGTAGSTFGAFSSAPQTEHKLQRVVNGAYQFQVYDSLNPLSLTTSPDATGTLAIELEFVRCAVASK